MIAEEIREKRNQLAQGGTVTKEIATSRSMNTSSVIVTGPASSAGWRRAWNPRSSSSSLKGGMQKSQLSPVGAQAPRTRSMTASAADRSIDVPRQATCWSGRTRSSGASYRSRGANPRKSTMVNGTPLAAAASMNGVTSASSWSRSSENPLPSRS